jgi:diguanylate cyclase (GGDEF)-like protein
VVVLIQADEEQSHLLAERVRKAVETMEVRSEDRILKVTVSIGSATYPYDAADKQELIDNADKAMYASKQGGRNRVSFFSQVKNTPAGIAPQPH